MASGTRFAHRPGARRAPFSGREAAPIAAAGDVARPPRHAASLPAALLLALSFVTTSRAAEPRRATDGDEGLRLYRQAPDFTLPPEVAGIVVPPATGRTGVARQVPVPTPTRAKAAVSAPRLLPGVPEGIPVVVKRSTPFRAAAFEDTTPADARPPRRPAPRRLEAPATLGVRAGASPASEASPRDAEAEIRGMLRAYLAAFNRHDAAALAACWNGECESVDLASGDVTQGRQAVEQVFAALFRADDRATIDLDVESIRLVRHDVAVVDAVSRIAFSEGGTAARSRLTAVVTREQGTWTLTNVRESPLPAEPSGPGAREIDGLDWLVGDWEDAGDGVSARTRCFWSTGRAFLIRCHTAAFDGSERSPAGADGIPGLLPVGSGDPREITEVIGWDPSTAAIRSWVFTSEGRFAEGIWTRHGDRWLVRMEGRGADAGSACTATLERIGTEKLAFRCTGDALADALPPACDFDRTGAAPEATLVR